MDFLHLFLMISVLVTGFGASSAYLLGREHGIAHERRQGIRVNCRAFIAALTKVMDVEADGGDSPEAYTGWAVREAERIVRQQQGGAK